MTSWNIEVLDTLDSSLTSLWSAAADTATSIWQLDGPFHAWCSHIAPALRQTPRFAVAEDKPGNLILFPLLFRRIGSVPFVVVTPLGGATQCDYQDPVLLRRGSSPPNLASLWSEVESAVRGGARVVEFAAYRLTSEFSPPSAKQNGQSHTIECGDVASLDIFLQSRSKKLRTLVQRHLKKGRSQNDLHLHRVDDANDIAASVASLAKAHFERWRRSFIAQAALVAYWTALAEWAHEDGSLHLTELHIDGQPVHWHLGFIHDKSLLWYKLGLDPKASQWSPGTLHLALLVNEAISNGLKRVDLGFGDESYKERWANGGVPLFTVQRSAPGVASTRRAMAFGNRVKLSLKRRLGQ